MRSMRCLKPNSRSMQEQQEEKDLRTDDSDRPEELYKILEN